MQAPCGAQSYLTPEQAQALDAARALAAAGIPFFVAEPSPSSNTGFRLPTSWQHTPADPRYVDLWRPGMALAMVMGHELDLIDVDPRSGADLTALAGRMPASYASADTPSGGLHSFIRTLGVRSRDNVLPGIDVKAGCAGAGHGFAFVAPTVRVSKTTGKPTPYRWLTLDLAGLEAVLRGDRIDDSGAALRELIESVRAPREGAAPMPAAPDPLYATLSVAEQEAADARVQRVVDDVLSELYRSDAWKPDQRDKHGRGWEKLQADAAMRLGQLARAPWNGYTLLDAHHDFVSSAPTDGTWTVDDVELKWRQQSRRGASTPYVDPQDAAAWGMFGLTPTPVPPVEAPR